MKLNGVPMPYGLERTLLLPFPKEKRGMLRDVRRLRFYLVSREFPDGARIWMQAGDFQLVKLREARAGLPCGEAGLEMYFGDAGEVNILEEGRHPRARVRVHTGPGCSLRASEKLTLRLTHMFSGKDTVLTVPLGRGVAAGSVAEIPCDLGAPPPGYYW